MLVTEPGMLMHNRMTWVFEIDSGMTDVGCAGMHLLSVDVWTDRSAPIYIYLFVDHVKMPTVPIYRSIYTFACLPLSVVRSVRPVCLSICPSFCLDYRATSVMYSPSIYIYVYIYMTVGQKSWTKNLNLGGHNRHINMILQVLYVASRKEIPQNTS